MHSNSDAVSTPSLQRLSPSASLSSWVSGYESDCLPVFIAIEVLNSRSGVKNNHAFARPNFACGTERLYSGEAGGSFGRDKETLGGSHFTRDTDHFVISNGNRAAVRLTKDIQNQEIADRFWNTQTRSNCVRVWKFPSAFLSRVERANDWRATSGLHGDHARTLCPDPAQRLHFIERFPHSNEPGPAAGGIKN